jgi:hypothetical protein
MMVCGRPPDSPAGRDRRGGRPAAPRDAGQRSHRRSRQAPSANARAEPIPPESARRVPSFAQRAPAKLTLQVTNRTRERRLRHMETLCRPPEMQLLRYGDEIAELPQLHRNIPGGQMLISPPSRCQLNSREELAPGPGRSGCVGTLAAGTTTSEALTWSSSRWLRQPGCAGRHSASARRRVVA